MESLVRYDFDGSVAATKLRLRKQALMAIHEAIQQESASYAA
jgi:hypothetical protein